MFHWKKIHTSVYSYTQKCMYIWYSNVHHSSNLKKNHHSNNSFFKNITEYYKLYYLIYAYFPVHYKLYSRNFKLMAKNNRNINCFWKVIYSTMFGITILCSFVILENWLSSTCDYFTYWFDIQIEKIVWIQMNTMECVV